MDLFRTDVDFQADLQRMPFDDASYDFILISRVLIIPPNFDACVDEVRRVLKPGGIAMISEFIDREQTQPEPNVSLEAVRHFGLSVLDDFAARFGKVEVLTSQDFSPEYQLIYRMEVAGKPFDDVPERVREPGVGVRELIALCYVDSDDSGASTSEP
jgi:SAM-dependent methyltransferase